MASTKHTVIADTGCDEGRIYVYGAPARMTNVKFHGAETDADGSICFRMTYDLEFEPIYQAAIHLGDD